MWNINGIGGKLNYIKSLINETQPDIILIRETKMYRPIFSHVYVGDDNYRLIQVRSTTHHRGGLAMLARKELQMITAEVMRGEHGRNFVHIVIKINESKEAIVTWYNSPSTSRQFFYAKLKQVIMKYNLRCLAGDLDARHPIWCKAHDEQRRGQQQLKLSRELRGVSVIAPVGPTFESVM